MYALHDQYDLCLKIFNTHPFHQNVVISAALQLAADPSKSNFQPQKADLAIKRRASAGRITNPFQGKH